MKNNHQKVLPLPGVYGFLNNEQIDAEYTTHGSKFSKGGGTRYVSGECQPCVDPKFIQAERASRFVGRIFFEKGEKDKRRRYCATCILIGPGTVATSRQAYPWKRNTEDSEESISNTYVVFSIYGNPLTCPRYPVRLESKLMNNPEKQDILLFSLMEDTPFDTRGLNVSNYKDFTSGDMLFLIGYPAFIDDENSSCITVGDKQQLKEMKEYLTAYSTKIVIDLEKENPDFVEYNQASLTRINHQALKQMTGTSGFGLFRIKQDQNEYVEWCGIVLIDDLVKTVDHLLKPSCSCLIEKVNYSEPQDFKTSHKGIPVFSFSDDGFPKHDSPLIESRASMCYLAQRVYKLCVFQKADLKMGGNKYRKTLIEGTAIKISPNAYVTVRHLLEGVDLNDNCVMVNQANQSVIPQYSPMNIAGWTHVEPCVLESHTHLFKSSDPSLFLITGNFRETETVDILKHFEDNEPIVSKYLLIGFPSCIASRSLIEYISSLRSFGRVSSSLYDDRPLLFPSNITRKFMLVGNEVSDKNADFSSNNLIKYNIGYPGMSGGMVVAEYPSGRLKLCAMHLGRDEYNDGVGLKIEKIREAFMCFCKYRERVSLCF